MISPLSTPAGIPGRPVLSTRMAPPGATVAAPVRDQVQVSAPAADAPEPVKRPSGRALLALGLVAAAATAGILGGIAMQQGEVEPARPVPARVVEAQPAAERAPVTLTMEAPEAAAVNLESSRLGGVPAPRPFQDGSLKLAEARGTETKDLDGRTLSLNWRHTGLEDTAHGNFYDAGDFTAALENFNQQATSDWSVHATMQPAGNTGRFASVIVSEGDAQAKTEQVTLRTYDRESGNQAFLKDLLGDEGFHVVMEAVQGRLAAADGASYRGADVEAWANQSFSLAQEGGQTRVTVAIPSQAGTTAQFTFTVAGGIQ